MLHLVNLLTLALIALNLVGLGLAVRRLSRLPLGIALPAGTLCLVLVFFFLEHLFGLGRLLWLLPFASVFAAASIWMSRRDFRDWRGGLLAFLAGFGYALLWRYFFPNIDASSEKIADLSFVAAYLPGDTLPPTDPWLPPYQFTQYYSIQHYGAALLGRLLGQPAGAAYNLGYCVLTGLVVAPVWEFGKSLGLGRIRRATLFLSLLVGGSGAALIVPFMLKDREEIKIVNNLEVKEYVNTETLWDTMRFAGCTTVSDDSRFTDFGLDIKKLGHIPDNPEANLDLPMEIFSYAVQLGDYHAPLGGFLMLTLSLAAFGLLLNAKNSLGAGFILGLCAVTTLAANTWIFPFQLLLLAAILGHLLFLAKPGVWPAPAALDIPGNRRRLLSRSHTGVVAGIVVAALLLYPFFNYFLRGGAGTGQGFACSLFNPEPGLFKDPATGEAYRFPLLTPFPYWLIIFWPAVGLIALGIYTRQPARKAFAWWGVFWIGILLLSELFYFNDDYGGHFERFNSTLKWWPWAYAGTLISLGAFHLTSPSLLRRILTGIILAGILFYAVALGRTWVQLDKSFAGRLDGTAWFRRLDRPGQTEEEIKRGRTRSNALLTFLSAQPRSVIVEPFYDDITTEGRHFPRMAFCETGYVALATGHQVVLGWASHQQLWRNYNKEIEIRLNDIHGLYEGKLPDTLGWLGEHKVRFIYWPDFADDPAGASWQRVKNILGPAYRWHSFDPASPRYGLFIRVEEASVTPPSRP